MRMTSGRSERSLVDCVTMMPVSTTDLHKALSQISAIRGQIARGAEFRGYGPVTVTVTGLLALWPQWRSPTGSRSPNAISSAYLTIWVPTAAVSLLIISVETIVRARRLHSGLAGQMMQAAAEQFCRRSLPDCC